MSSYNTTKNDKQYNNLQQSHKLPSLEYDLYLFCPCETEHFIIENENINTDTLMSSLLELFTNNDISIEEFNEEEAEFILKFISNFYKFYIKSVKFNNKEYILLSWRNSSDRTFNDGPLKNYSIYNRIKLCIHNFFPNIYKYSNAKKTLYKFKITENM